jgi:hypothetical protein
MATTDYADSDYNALFKQHYFKLADNVYSTFSNLYSMVPKTFNFGGNTGENPVGVTFGGSVGSSATGNLPTARSRKYLKPTYTRTGMYGVLDLNTETIQASMGPDAFLQATEEQTLGVIKSFNRNMARAFINGTTGTLGTHSGNFGGTAAAPVATILDTSSDFPGFVPGYWEIGDYVDVIDSGSSVFGTSEYEVTAVSESAKTVTLGRVNGSDDLTGIGAGTHEIVMQNSWDTDPTGFQNMFDATIHGLSTTKRWDESSDVDANGAGISPDFVNQMVEEIDTEADEPPTVLGFSPTQYRKYLNLLEDQKRYPQTVMVRPRANSRTSASAIKKANIGFPGIEYISTQGAIPILKNKMIRNTQIHAFNMNHVEASHAKRFGWFDNDGSVLHMKESSDGWIARYGGFMEIRWNPMYVGRVKELAV